MREIFHLGPNEEDLPTGQCVLFFFPPVWPIRTRHGPYNCVSSESSSVQDSCGPKSPANHYEKQTRTTKTTTKNDPQIPQPDLRFATFQDSEATKKGAGPNKNQTNKKALRFALDTATLATVSSSKTCKLINCGGA